MPKDALTYSDWVKSIKETKEDLWDDFEGDDQVEKEYAKSYSPYLVNKSLINSKNILLLNELNGLPHLDKKMQYDYLLHSIPKGQTYKSVSKSKQKKREEKKAELHKEIEKMKGIGGMKAPLKV
jgi:hypothetical protein